MRPFPTGLCAVGSIPSVSVSTAKMFFSSFLCDRYSTAAFASGTVRISVASRHSGSLPVGLLRGSPGLDPPFVVVASAAAAERLDFAALSRTTSSARAEASAVDPAVGGRVAAACVSPADGACAEAGPPDPPSAAAPPSDCCRRSAAKGCGCGREPNGLRRGRVSFVGAHGFLPAATLPLLRHPLATHPRPTACAARVTHRIIGRQDQFLGSWMRAVRRAVNLVAGGSRAGGRSRKPRRPAHVAGRAAGRAR